MTAQTGCLTTTRACHCSYNWLKQATTSGSAITEERIILKSVPMVSSQKTRSTGTSHGLIWASTMTSPISKLSSNDLGPRKSSTLAIRKAQCKCTMPCHTSKKNSLLTASLSLSLWLLAPSQRHKVLSKCSKTFMITTS